MNELDDLALVRKILDGDKTVLDELLLRFQHRALTWARRQLHPRDAEADEVVQSALITFFRRIQKYDEKRASPWVFFFQILRSCLLDHLRLLKRLPLPLPNALPAPADPPSSIDLTAIPGFSENDRKILLADALDPKGQIPNRDFAEAEGIPENAVSTQRARARERASKVFGAWLPPDESAVLRAFHQYASAGLSCADLARMVGISEHEFETRLSRALHLIEEYVRESGSKSSDPDEGTKETGDS
jgi:RNA polymerase sigma factor (sigma-70 family)